MLSSPSERWIFCAMNLYEYNSYLNGMTVICFYHGYRQARTRHKQIKRHFLRTIKKCIKKLRQICKSSNWLRIIYRKRIISQITKSTLMMEEFILMCQQLLLKSVYVFWIKRNSEIICSTENGSWMEWRIFWMRN